MDISWHGQACFKIKAKSATILIDPFDPTKTGLKSPKDLSADMVLKTHDHPDHNYFDELVGDPVQISGPGEYEVKGVSIVGVSTFHDKTEGSERGKNTVYNLQVDGLSIVHLGDLGHLLTENQIASIGNTDILMIPVGGFYTIDAKEAAEVVAQLEPSVILPMHYSIDGHNPNLTGVEPFLKEMGIENISPLPKLSITKDKLPDEPQVVVLTKS